MIETVIEICKSQSKTSYNVLESESQWSYVSGYCDTNVKKQNPKYIPFVSVLV
jgi:hypothetical protein